MSSDSKQIAHEFIEEVLNKGDLQNIESFVTPDFIYHNTVEDVKGIENFRECISSDHSIYPDIHLTILDSIAELGKVSTAFIVEGTHRKEFRGIPATNKKFETVGVNICHFEGNKIKEAWVIVDGLTAALQVGAVKTVEGANQSKT